MFQDWREHIKDNPQISPHLLWDMDMKEFDMQKGRRLVIERVLERGGMNDFYAMIILYGGINKVKKIIEEEVYIFDPRIEALVKAIFNIQKEAMKCYEKKRLREIYLNS